MAGWYYASSIWTLAGNSVNKFYMKSELSQYKQLIKNKKILIWGLGLQGGGLSSASFFAQNGAIVKITDLKNEKQLQASLQKLANYSIEYKLGNHEQADFEWADIVVVNQDIFHRSGKSPFLQYLLQDHPEKFETEMGLFFKFCTIPIIGITGSRGKTTTTTALGQMLKAAGKKVFVGGNIPNSMNLAMIEEVNNQELAVLELSNYQLRGIDYVKKSPQIAVITSISPDHFISYSSFANYVADKKIIYRYQKQDNFLLIKKDDPYSDEFYKEAASKVVVFDKNSLPQNWNLQIPGQHNRENLGAVYKVGKLLNLDEEIIKKSLSNFDGVAFRLQNIGNINDISFINDTTATTPTAAAIALKSFSANRIIWIGGGNTKNLPLDSLVETVNTQVKKIIMLKGLGTDELLPLLKNRCSDFNSRFVGVFDDFAKAINRAYQLAKAGDIILLSPGFTSFGMFQNEFDRGKQFNDIVKKIESTARAEEEIC